MQDEGSTVLALEPALSRGGNTSEGPLNDAKHSESWLVAATMLVEITEEFVAIILDIYLWRMLLEFAIYSARGFSHKKKRQNDEHG